MSSDQPVNFKKGKIPRNELELPTLHFVVVDQWIDVIGDKALMAWLKMYSWCDRSENDEQVNYWEQAKIPTSFTKIVKRLGIGKSTFYNQILKPLWNVGLIDIEEHTVSDNKGQKPMNIVVYKYPQNNKELAHKPIVSIRDYDEDYHSNARTFAKKKRRNQSSNLLDKEDEVLKILEEKPIYEKAGEFLYNKKVSKEEILETILELHSYNIDYFTWNQLESQFEFMMEEEEKGHHIHAFPQYFVGGLSKRLRNHRLHKNFRREKEEEIQKRKEESEQRKSKGIYYNWLEE